MDGLSKAYSNMKSIVAEFANSSTGEYSHTRSVNILPKQNREPYYAETDDNYLDGVIDNIVSKNIFRNIIDNRFKKQLDGIIRHSVELNNESFPQLFSIYSHCCCRLGIYNCPKTYVTSFMSGINALSLEVCNIPYILLSRDVIFNLDDKEQSFLIGHELGHYQQGNLVCHTLNGLLSSFINSQEVLGPMLAEAIEVPLRRWYRQREFNADRAGFLCCGDILAVKSLFSRLGMIQSTDEYSLYKQLSEGHPLLSTRFHKLQSFVH